MSSLTNTPCARTVPVSEVRDHLDALKKRHSVAGIALAVGLTPRSVRRLFTTDAFIYRTTAERIVAAAQRCESRGPS